MCKNQLLITGDATQYMFASLNIGLHSFSLSGTFSHNWIFDFGVSHYMLFNVKYFVSLYTTSLVSIMIVVDTSMPSSGIRSVSTSHMPISNIYYIPNLITNLV